MEESGRVLVVLQKGLQMLYFTSQEPCKEKYSAIHFELQETSYILKVLSCVFKNKIPPHRLNDLCSPSTHPFQLFPFFQISPD